MFGIALILRRDRHSLDSNSLRIASGPSSLALLTTPAPTSLLNSPKTVAKFSKYCLIRRSKRINVPRWFARSRGNTLDMHLLYMASIASLGKFSARAPGDSSLIKFCLSYSVAEFMVAATNSRKS